ncbi:hypothetical protein LPJ59_002060 [Coemansia sp. RSA 2399]|nr:hypothetical protein LPJ59_002060 [Coemansia sp. RSA 2399]KAJ1905097.1 hypothetical protein LPJ81_002112 [Coemansia sp. IMI 209127]
MANLEQTAFERELSAYVTRQDAGGLPENLMLTLSAVVTCGYALHSVRFGQAEATPDPGAAPTGRLDELINGLDDDIEQFRVNEGRAREAYRQPSLGIFNIGRLRSNVTCQTPITLEYLRHLDQQYAALRAERQALERDRQAIIAAARAERRALEREHQAAYDTARTLYIRLL